MHSTSYQTLLILLPIIITGSQALPDNVFGKREAFAPILEERWGHGPPGGHTGGSSGGPPSGQGPCSLGWQACMSSLCASVAGGETDTAGPTGTTEVPPVAATADATGTDLSDALTTSLGAGSKMRRQADISTATGAGETGDGTGLAPTATGTGSGMQGFGRNGPGGLAAFCSGFSDFAQSGVNTGTMEATGTVDPTDPTDTADNTDASTATPTS